MGLKGRSPGPGIRMPVFQTRWITWGLSLTSLHLAFLIKKMKFSAFAVRFNRGHFFSITGACVYRMLTMLQESARASSAYLIPAPRRQMQMLSLRVLI
jgi:hypothetical protein